MDMHGVARQHLRRVRRFTHENWVPGADDAPKIDRDALLFDFTVTDGGAIGTAREDGGST